MITFDKLLHYNSAIFVTNANRRVWQTQTPGHTRHGVWCLRGASIPCRPATSAVIPFSNVHNNPISKEIKQEETRQDMMASLCDHLDENSTLFLA
jgi:hypothetical protein